MPTPATPTRLALTVGPVLYHWPRQRLFDFYAGIAESSADSVVLGQTVCSRRRELKLDDWLALARELAAQGKEVVLATQTLIESEADLRALHQQAEQFDGLLEAGDASALQRLAGKAPFVLGPHINIYNRPALLEHARLGAVRWVAPAELSMAALAQINPPSAPVQGPGGTPIATEVFAFGRLPLAFSARCFTARHYNLPKDDCQFSCVKHADGLLMSTREKEGFLVLNGTQTQSARVYNLLPELEQMRLAGVDVLRISPQSQHCAEIVGLFHEVLTQQTSAPDAMQSMLSMMPDQPCNGYWYGKPGMEQLAVAPEHA